jgi:uncharacterized membrane protein YkvA (DUF1232 family)
MALEFNVTIQDDDLNVFMDAMKRAEQRASSKTAEQILDEAEKTFASASTTNMPDFISSRISSVGNLIAMARDKGWGLADDDRNRIISALTYFADPEDLIPDNVPVLGFLDDAIMIEVVQRVLQPEIDAYADFCAYRSDEAARRGEDVSSFDRAEWLDGRRAELQSRMRSRRGSYAPSSSWAPAFKFS